MKVVLLLVSFGLCAAQYPNGGQQYPSRSRQEAVDRQLRGQDQSKTGNTPSGVLKMARQFYENLKSKVASGQLRAFQNDDCDLLSASFRINEDLGVATNSSTIEDALDYVGICNSTSELGYRKVKRGVDEAIDDLDLVSDTQNKDDVVEVLALIRLEYQIMFEKFGAIFAGTQVTIARESMIGLCLKGCLGLMTAKYEDWDRALLRIVSTANWAVKILEETGSSVVLPQIQGQLISLFESQRIYAAIPTQTSREALVQSCKANNIETKADQVVQEFLQAKRPSDKTVRRAFEIASVSLNTFASSLQSICYVVENLDTPINDKGQKLLNYVAAARGRAESLDQQIRAWEQVKTPFSLKV